MIRTIVTGAAFSPDVEMARFASQRADACGAVVSFVGYCRGQSKQGPVLELELQHYPGFTESEIRRLAAAIGKKRGVADILIIHRAGVVAAGEPIVLVAAMSPHRAAAFASRSTASSRTSVRLQNANRTSGAPSSTLS